MIATLYWEVNLTEASTMVVGTAGCPSVYVSICLYLFRYPSIHLSTYLSIYLSIPVPISIDRLEKIENRPDIEMTVLGEGNTRSDKSSQKRAVRDKCCVAGLGMRRKKGKIERKEKKGK